MDYPSESDIANLESTRILGQLVAVHWLKIHRENVLPLIGSSSPLSSHTETQLASKYYAKEPIAIVGMSCRYPSANNLEEFWELLFNGQDRTGTHPEFRWARDQCSRSSEGCIKTNAGFLKVPLDEFDAKFFGNNTIQS